MPKSFENSVRACQALNQGLLQSVRLVGEYRGKEALFKQQSPQVLQALRDSALIQSTESSNRIEGVVAPPQRIRDLVAKRTQPANRSEQEIAGYREVLNTIHTNFADMPLTSNLVLQLHRDLFQFVPGGGGRWKSTDNDITETRPDGTTVVRFTPLAAHLTPDAMARLHDAYRTALDDRPGKVSSVLFSDFSQLLGLGEQIGLTSGTRVRELLPDLTKVRAIGLSSTSGESDTTTELRLEIP